MAQMLQQRRGVTDCVERALIAVQSEQLSTGEIPNYRRLDGDHWEYCFSPLVSALTHDALGVLDPLSTSFDAHGLEQAAGDRRSIVGRLAARIRHRIRRFLAWQQRTDGTWRFYGHGSPLPSDLETTVFATAALLDGSDGRTFPGLVSASALGNFVREHGLFYSPGSRGEDDAPPDAWAARAINVELLRCLILEGADGRPLIETLANQSSREEDGSAASLPFWHAIGRLCRRTRIPSLEEIARRSILRLIADSTQRADLFASPLACGVWLTVLVDFRCEAAIGSVVETVADWLDTPARRRNDAVTDPRCAGPGLTTAVGLAALVRAAALVELN